MVQVIAHEFEVIFFFLILSKIQNSRSVSAKTFSSLPSSLNQTKCSKIRIYFVSASWSENISSHLVITRIFSLFCSLFIFSTAGYNSDWGVFSTLWVKNEEFICRSDGKYKMIITKNGSGSD